jgi:hypothetical protein
MHKKEREKEKVCNATIEYEFVHLIRKWSVHGMVCMKMFFLVANYMEELRCIGKDIRGFY